MDGGEGGGWDVGCRTWDMGMGKGMEYRIG